MRIRIEGIYDKRTLEILREENINDFSFDFRPKSFNFLQQYRFMDIMASYYSPKKRYYCHFCDEAPNVIQKITTDLREALGLGGPPWAQSFFLEFSGHESPEAMDAHGMPFLWHYSPQHPLAPILRCQFLKGIVLEYEFLRKLHEEEMPYHFRQHFLESSASFLKERQGELFLRRSWDSDIFPSLYELLDFTVTSIPIDNKIENSYRRVDLQRMRREIKNLRP